MLWTAFILGLLGSFHCVGMCGPIAFLLPLDRKSEGKRMLQLASYHIGRLSTYGLIGALFGLIGRSLNLFAVQQQVSIGIGVLMILVVLIPARLFNRYNFSKPMYSLVGKLKSSMGNQLKDKSAKTFVTMGLLNGLLPCGLVYMAVFGTLASGNAIQGAWYMVFFGLGTVPLMTAAIYLGNFLKTSVKQKVMKLIPVFVIVIGLLFIIRGLGLGIKYISPAVEVANTRIGATTQYCH